MNTKKYRITIPILFLLFFSCSNNFNTVEMNNQEDPKTHEEHYFITVQTFQDEKALAGLENDFYEQFGDFKKYFCGVLFLKTGSSHKSVHVTDNI